MKLGILIALLATILTSCALAPTEMPTLKLTSTPVPPTSTATLPVVFTMTPSPVSEQPTIAVSTPDAMQVEIWKEYQAELAKAVTCESGHDCPNYEHALCEWDILGQSGQEVFVWAICETLHAGDRKPAVIYLAANGSIRNVEVPIRSSSWDSNILRLFPADVRKKLDLYYFLSCPYCGRPETLRTHLQYRQTNPDEPPLIVLSATPAATPTP